jgi:integrase/recombinase XerD
MTAHTPGSGGQGRDAEAVREARARLGRADPDPFDDPAFISECERWTAGGADLFDLWFTDGVAERNDGEGLKPGSVTGYERTVRYWREHMAADDSLGGGGRHPAAPSEAHVRSFIDRLYRPEKRGGRGNAKATVELHAARLRAVFRWFGTQRDLPHAAHHGYDPVAPVVGTYPWGETPDEKRPHKLTPTDLRDGVARVTNVRDRAMLVLQMKLGLRAGEVRNIQLGDLALTDTHLQRHYAGRLGTHPDLPHNRRRESTRGDRPAEDDEWEPAVVIPHDRPGNKSEVSRTLPLDDECVRVLVPYLLLRPDVAEPWVFLSRSGYSRIDDPNGLNRVWEQAFPREGDDGSVLWGETDTRRAVSSHTGRHTFATHLRVEEGVEETVVQYALGHRITARVEGGRPRRDAIDTYTHVDYDHLKPVYLASIYRVL